MTLFFLALLGVNGYAACKSKLTASHTLRLTSEREPRIPAYMWGESVATSCGFIRPQIPQKPKYRNEKLEMETPKLKEKYKLEKLNYGS